MLSSAFKQLHLSKDPPIQLNYSSRTPPSRWLLGTTSPLPGRPNLYSANLQFLSNRFLGHRFTKAQVELLESESQLPMPVSSWTINLSILWASDDITPCDMHQLSHLLADEIYNKLDAKEEEWLEEEEEEEEIRDPDAASVLEKALGSDLDADIQKYYAEKYEEKSLLSEWGDSEEEGYGSSEETSSEEYDEEAIADMMLGKEEDTIAKEEEEEDPFHENDYDYMADVRGEYDEVEVEKEVEGLVEQTLYDSDDYYK